jgi:glutamyl-tRNA synthetase
MKDLILKHALKNALDFNGKANPGAVLGRVLSENPEFKKDIPRLKKDIEIVVKGLEKLTPEEQKQKLKQLSPKLLKEKKVKKKDKLEISKAKKGKVVTRFAPSPSGPMHIGHSYVLSLNSELARKHKGKLILRIEDTNPENIYPSSYTMLPDEGKWITKNNVSKIVIQSERLGIYYDHAEKLVNLGKAYVCTCNTDQWRKLKAAAKACKCRNLTKKEQQIRYAKMFNEYAEGEAVLKLKTDIQDKNPATRDFSIRRINEHRHPKTQNKQRVWPLMNYSVAIDDALLGVTHSIRAKDHMDNGKKQRIIHGYLKLPTPTDVYVGRINFSDLKISASQTKMAIERKEYTGWDDIRLPFLAALKRRGYQPEAFIKYALDVGITQTDKTVSKDEFFKAINAFNKGIIEPQASRFFFIQVKKKIKIKKAPAQECQVPLHPDFRKRGYRKFKTKTDFLINAKDLARLKSNKVHRLMDCVNFVKKNNEFIFHSTDYEEFKKAKNKGIIIHWLPAEEKTIDVEVLMEDNTKLNGLGEHKLKDLKVGEIIQFERAFFVKLDKKDKNKLFFWYLHT